MGDTQVNADLLQIAQVDNHLRGEKGASVLGIVCKGGEFKPASVGMGLSPSCPVGLRMQIKAQANYRANEEGPVTEDSIRVRNLLSAVLGLPMVICLTVGVLGATHVLHLSPVTYYSLIATGALMGTPLMYRVTRAVVRLGLAPITLLYSAYQQHKFGIDDWVKEDAKRIGYEWIDAGVAAATSVIGLVNMVVPNAIKLAKLQDYYLARHTDTTAKNQQFAEAKQQYLGERQVRIANEKAAREEVTKKKINELDDED
ncbi:MAG: hypothetical protein K940chlam9_00167 [Chlamydiae bacterium]|nr:hypothetical protein [Chlamydiota bacterium]